MDLPIHLFGDSLKRRGLEPLNTRELRCLLKSCPESKEEEFRWIIWIPQWVDVVGLFGLTFSQAVRAMKDLSYMITRITYPGFPRIHMRSGMGWDNICLHDARFHGVPKYYQQTSKPFVDVSFDCNDRTKLCTVYIAKENLSCATLLAAYQTRMKYHVLGSIPLDIRSFM
jgi:hypothetical protein